MSTLAKTAHIAENLSMKIRHISLCLVVLFAFTSPKILSAQSGRPLVTGIKTQIDTSSITLSWQLPSESQQKNVLSYVIFRSQKPYATGDSITDDIPLATVPVRTQIYKDSVTTATVWYYCVIAKLTDGSLYDVIIPTANATATGAAIPSPEVTGLSSRDLFEERESAVIAAPQDTEIPLRSTPLPYLHIIKNEKESPEVIPPYVVANADKLGRDAKKNPEKTERFIFERDTKDTSNGDDYTLYAILATYFTKGDYGAAEAGLRTFLQTNHGIDITARSTIYLGQTLYFQGKYKDALTCFLSTEGVYPAISKRWIQLCLDAYEY